MAAAGKLRYAYLAYLAKPAEDRALYRAAKRLQVRRILELGIGSLQRTLNLVSVCQRYAGEEPISYTGLDWFEERPAASESLSLIDAHRKLKAAGATARLMPGGPVASLPAVANSVMGTDLILFSEEATEEALAPHWFYLPRVCHTGTVILSQAAGSEDEPRVWTEVPRKTVDQLAANVRTQRAA